MGRVAFKDKYLHNTFQAAFFSHYRFRPSDEVRVRAMLWLGGSRQIAAINVIKMEAKRTENSDTGCLECSV